MAHFYGVLRAGRSETTRTGTKGSGLEAVTASWGGSIRVGLYHDENTGVDMARVTMEPWKGRGESRVLYEGPVGGASEAVKNPARSDVLARDEGTIVEFMPVSRAAKQWFNKNVQSESWQWLGDWLCVDHRVAPDLIAGLEEDGLVVAKE